ncbi:MAG: hypothetical protein IT453_04970 [Planctomycetes bacterium]|nr:hypothetical protein [Planctomycetota bacterium]
MFALVLSLALGGQVHTVGSGQTFATIQAAVDAAQDGDVVLVRAGAFPGFAIDGKALTIAADEGASVIVNGEVRVEHTPAGKPTLLSGLDVFAGGAEALFLRNDLGAVHVRGGTYRGYPSPAPYESAGQAARVTQNGLVRIVGASVRGGNGWCFTPMNCNYAPSSGGPACFARATELELFDCTLTGGSGGTDWTDQAYDGGHGARAYESPDVWMFASNSTFQGGSGGHGGEEQGCCDLFGIAAGNGGNGGDGIFLGSQPPGTESPVAELLDCATFGGPPGFGGLGYCCASGPSGTPGQPIRVNNGVHVPLAGVARSVSGTRVARERTSLSLAFTGVAGDRVRMRVESLHPKSVGGLALPLPKEREVAVLPASGQLAVQLPLGGLHAPLEAITWFVAFDFVASDGTVRRGTPLAIVIVGAQF